jgi:hypothetical protein
LATPPIAFFVSLAAVLQGKGRREGIVGLVISVAVVLLFVVVPVLLSCMR